MVEETPSHAPAQMHPNPGPTSPPNANPPAAAEPPLRVPVGASEPGTLANVRKFPERFVASALPSGDYELLFKSGRRVVVLKAVYERDFTV